MQLQPTELLSWRLPKRAELGLSLRERERKLASWEAEAMGGDPSEAKTCLATCSVCSLIP